jgi:hypothetical protein
VAPEATAKGGQKDGRGISKCRGAPVAMSRERRVTRKWPTRQGTTPIFHEVLIAGSVSTLRREPAQPPARPRLAEPISLDFLIGNSRHEPSAAIAQRAHSMLTRS